MARALAAVLAVVTACASDDGGGASGDAGAPDANGVDAAPPAWEAVEVLFDDGEVVTERVKYRSGSLLIDGQVCRPKAGGPYPVIVFNHGGFMGLGIAADSGNCVDSARAGFVWIGSSYRGEDASEGAIEVCLGEVDDVLAMIDVALAQPYADRDRVVMWGGSHGGCITTRAVERAAPVHAAVDVFGPADLASNYQFWVDQIDAGTGPTASYQQLVQVVDDAIGGPPDEYQDDYAARSPGNFELPAGLPFMVTHGTVDELVPVAQSCDLVAGAGGFTAFHLDGSQAEVTSPPVGCEDAGLTWSAGVRPSPGWPGSRYLVVYDGLGHGFGGAAGNAMLGDVLTFLMAKLPP
jgi:dipeptidyl aminopeptidase/acylaminoacyl peptidase